MMRRFRSAAEVGALDLVVVEELGAGAGFDHFADLEDVGAVCYAERFFGVLLDEQNGCAEAIDGFDHIEDSIYVEGGETHTRLVEEEELRG